MIVYKITNKINNKIYIGQTTKNNEEYFGSGTIIIKAIAKYGKDNFLREILETCISKEHLDEREKYWISFYNSTNRNIGYNVSIGGTGGNLGIIVNDLISKNRTGKGLGRTSPMKGKISNNKGIPMLESQKILLRKPKTKEHREALSLAKKGKSASRAAIENSAKARQRKIICINTSTIYNSIKDAAEDLKLKSPNIIGVLKNKSTHTKGYNFKYYEDNKENNN